MTKFQTVKHMIDSNLSLSNIDKFFVITILKRCFEETSYSISADTLQQQRSHPRDASITDYLSNKFIAKKSGCYSFNICCYGFADGPCFVAVEVKIPKCGRIANFVLYSDEHGQFSQTDLFEMLAWLEADYVGKAVATVYKAFGKNSF